MSDFEENSGNEAQESQEPQKKKLTDVQLRIAQAAAGVLCAVALIVSLYLPMQYVTDESSLIKYLFLVVFLVIMFGRRWIENKFRLRLGLFGLVLIDGIFMGILAYLVYIFYYTETTMLDVWKLVILIGGVVVLLGAGIAWPLMRYFKRKENGTLPPIRLPEKKEAREGEEKKEETGGPLTTEQKIAAMMRDIDEPKGKDGE